MVGHETTSCTVSFTLYELARHPEVQRKLRQEVAGITDFSYDGINSLPYLDAVCKEGCVLLCFDGHHTDQVIDYVYIQQQPPQTVSLSQTM